jgi:predicted TIM-barrel fold metal-dependent hydrolase
MSDFSPPTDAWLDQVVEDVVDPDLPIVDPHHHLWPPGGPLPYGLAELHADTQSGHRVEQTVFVECGAAYSASGPPDLAPVGESAFVAGEAQRDPHHLISGIVAHANLRSDRLDEILDAHVDASRGLFRGIRDSLSRAEHPEALMIPGGAPAELYLDAAFRAGVRRLGERGFTYDTWHYHYQIPELAALALAVPGTTMVLDHFGTPLGVGPYASQRDEIYEQWKLDIAQLARCDNVVAKLGGLAMPDNGFGWDKAPRPPTSDEFVSAQSPYYLHTIEVFGPHRCMFESNFPVDRFSLSYRVLWNAFKKLTADFEASERAALFSDTARRVYRLEAATATP